MADKTTRTFYGWAIVGMGALGNAVQGGFIFWSMGLYTSTFEDVFQATRAKITFIETCISASVNLMFPIAGYFVDRRSARHFAALGTFSAGLGLILVSMAGELLHIWIVFATLIPLGVLALGVLPSSALISRWFKQHRGLGLGISVAGSSVGGFIVPLAMAAMFVAFGWRTALMVSGLFIICLAPIFYVVLANFPEDRGYRQLGASDRDAWDSAPVVRKQKPGWTIHRLLQTPMTYVQAILSGTLLAITLGMLANLSLHAKDLGFSTGEIGALYSVIAACSFGGKIAVGAIVDRAGVNFAIGMTIGLMALAMLAFMFASSFYEVLGAALLLGLGMGGVTPVWTAMIAGTFGANSFGRAIGVQNPMHIPITAPSAPIAGHISDTTGSYELVFVMYFCFAIIAGIALLTLRKMRLPDIDEIPPSH